MKQAVGQLMKLGAEVTYRENSAILKIKRKQFKFGTGTGKLFKMNCRFARMETQSESGCNEFNTS